MYGEPHCTHSDSPSKCGGATAVPPDPQIISNRTEASVRVITVREILYTILQISQRPWPSNKDAITMIYFLNTMVYGHFMCIIKHIIH